jgi:hypothetical protein
VAGAAVGAGACWAIAAAADVAAVSAAALTKSRRLIIRLSTSAAQRVPGSNFGKHSIANDTQAIWRFLASLPPRSCNGLLYVAVAGQWR